MCTVMLALAVGSAVMQAGQAHSQAKGQQAYYEYNSKVQANNQQMANWNAEDAQRRGKEEEADLRERARLFKGSQRARLAANGISLDEGSALNILSDTDLLAERDISRSKNNTNKEVYAFKNQAQGYGAESAMLKAKGSSINPMMEAGSSLLSNAGSVASRWDAYKARK